MIRRNRFGRSKPAFALKIVVLGSGAALVVLGSSHFWGSNTSTTITVSALSAVSHSSTKAIHFVSDPVDAADEMSSLEQVGINADTLAAVGVNSQGVTTVLATADDWFTDHASALRQARADVATYSAQCTLIRRSLRRGNSTYQPSDLTTAAQALTTAQASWNQQLDSLWTAVSADLSEGAAGQIQTIKSASKWAVSDASRLANRTDDQWLALERAQRFAAPSEVDQADAAVETGVEQSASYITAQSNRTAYRTADCSAWDSHWSQ